jgi:hypothetical protein
VVQLLTEMDSTRSDNEGIFVLAATSQPWGISIQLFGGLAVSIGCFLCSHRAEAAFDAIPFDDEAARSYGRVYAAVVGAGRKAPGARAVDLLIAATALAAGLPLFTRNADDFRVLDALIDVVAVP